MPEAAFPGRSSWRSWPRRRAARAQRPEPPAPPPAPALERVTFDEAVQRALEHNPTVAEAAQAILRAQALLDQAQVRVPPARSTGGVGTTILDAAARLRRQHHPAADAVGLQRDRCPTRSSPPRAGPRKNQAADQVRDRADLRARRRAARWRSPPRSPTWPSSPPQRQREIAIRNRDTGPGPRRLRARAARGGPGQPAQPRALVPGAARPPRAALRARGAGRAPGPGGPRRRHLRRRSRRRERRSRAAAARRRPRTTTWLHAAARRPPLHRAGRRRPTGWCATPGSPGSRRASASFTPAVRHARGLLRAGRDLARGLPAPGPDLRRHPGRHRSGVRIADRETARLRLDAVKVRGALRAAAGPGGRGAQRADRGREPPRPPRARPRRCASREIAYRRGRHQQHRGGPGAADGAQRRDRAGRGRGPAAPGAARPAWSRWASSRSSALPNRAPITVATRVRRAYP